jgi:hypothetical protein
MATFRISRDLLEREKAISREWVRRFPLWVAFHLEPKEPRGQETTVENYGDVFWGRLLLALGFAMQAVSLLLPSAVESSPQGSILTVYPGEDAAAQVKDWTIGLLFSLVIGGFAAWGFLKALRLWLGVAPKPKLAAGSRDVPPRLTGAVERLFFTVLVGVEGLSH